MSNVTQNVTQPQSTTSTQPELVTRVPAALVTTKPLQHSEPAPPLPRARGLTPPTKGLLPAKSTENLPRCLEKS